MLFDLKLNVIQQQRICNNFVLVALHSKEEKPRKIEVISNLVSVRKLFKFKKLYFRWLSLCLKYFLSFLFGIIHLIIHCSIQRVFCLLIIEIT